jgi:EF hand
MNKGLIIAVALTISAAAGEAAVFAQQTSPPPQQDQTATPRRAERRARVEKRVAARFKKVDANGDGVISRDEWRRNPRAFDRFDTNHDGVVSADELKAVIAARVKRHRR